MKFNFPMTYRTAQYCEMLLFPKHHEFPARICVCVFVYLFVCCRCVVGEPFEKIPMQTGKQASKPVLRQDKIGKKRSTQ